MEFSSNILIDFGLNLAGYLVAALLMYVLIGRVRPAEQTGSAAEASHEKPRKAMSRPSNEALQRPRPDPEFIPLADREKSRPDLNREDGGDRSSSSMIDEQNGIGRRHRNRRAIYEEARRLLAGGASHTDLLSRLPVTESELDILTVTEKA
jgi:hypothetical protein